MSIFRHDAKITINSYPFNYMLIEDAFPAALASSLELLFRELITDGRKIGKVGEVGELIYDAVNFTPLLHHVQHTTLATFASADLRTWMSNSFDIRLDENLMLGMHRHQAPSKAGWAHTDFAVVSFPNEPPNFDGNRIFYDDCGCNYSDDSRDRQPNTIKTARAIACLYYTGNPEWMPGMGGETGVFADFGKRLVASIPPKNNSLFAFEISPISYHAYLGSDSAQRNSYIWWYHAQPDYLLSRHRDVANMKLKLDMDPWDRWTDTSVPKFEVSLANA